MELYRRGELSERSLRLALGLSRLQVDALLKLHGIYLSMRRTTCPPNQNLLPIYAMLVVADTSPLNYLIQLGCIDVLPRAVSADRCAQGSHC